MECDDVSQNQCIAFFSHPGVLPTLFCRKKTFCVYVYILTNVLLLPVLILNLNQVPVQSWRCCGLKTESDCSTSATPPTCPLPQPPPRPPMRPRCRRGHRLWAAPPPAASSRRRWQHGEASRPPRRPSGRLRRTRANRRATSCT